LPTGKQRVTIELSSSQCPAAQAALSPSVATLAGFSFPPVSSVAMPYSFRLRFELAHTHHIGVDHEELELFADGNQRLILRTGQMGNPIKEPSRAAVVGYGYESPEAAQSAGERARRALLRWAVYENVGIDLGGGLPRGLVTNEGLAMFQEQLGVPLRNDVHGLDVYEHIDGMRFMLTQATAVVGKNPETLAKSFASAFHAQPPASDKLLLASELYCASFFDFPDRSRFITLVTAIEALLAPTQRNDSAQALVDRICDLVRHSELSENTKNSMLGAIDWLRYDSILNTGRRLASTLLRGKTYANMTPERFFTHCYNLRSQIVHNGTPKDRSTNIRNEANNAAQFIADLLRASWSALETH
jgi:hypothetical protein